MELGRKDSDPPTEPYVLCRQTLSLFRGLAEKDSESLPSMAQRMSIRKRAPLEQFFVLQTTVDDSDGAEGKLLRTGPVRLGCGEPS